MICPICQKRKAKRYCPAKSELICTVCCGTEREVTIDCPSDCPHLIASREHYDLRRPVDWDKVPFADKKIFFSVLEAHERLFLQLSYVILEYAQDNPSLVDSDVEAAYQALAETYLTLSSGILYEKPPDHRMQRELYDRLRKGVEDYKQEEGPGLVAQTSVRDPDIRDALILFTQITARRSNGRPKGRAFLDFIRSQFKPGTFSSQTAGSGIILAP